MSHTVKNNMHYRYTGGGTREGGGGAGAQETKVTGQTIEGRRRAGNRWDSQSGSPELEEIAKKASQYCIMLCN